MERVIFHVDVNSAFLSWESVRRINLGESDLRKIPAVIGGDPKNRTNVVLAKSIPAKEFNIQTGEAMATAVRKCPSLVYAEPDFKLYRECSKAFKDICRRYAPMVEEFSIDECFMDMTGTEKMYPDLLATAYKLKDEIKNTLGFTVNVGVGSNKLLAKMASDFEKPDKVHTLFTHEVSEKMWPLSVGDLLFCGKKTSARLKSVGIYTIGDLAKTDYSYLKQLFGEKSASSLYNSANGIDTSPVNEHREENKGYSMCTTTEENIESYDAAIKIVAMLCEKLAAKLRHDGFKTYNVGVGVRFTDFTNKSHQKKLENATDITGEIYSVAKELLYNLWDGHEPLRLIRVQLSKVTHESYEQLSIFDIDNPAKEKARKMDKALDEIRTRFGSSAIEKGTKNL